jgi:hypothetical protein
MFKIFIPSAQVRFKKIFSWLQIDSVLSEQNYGYEKKFLFISRSMSEKVKEDLCRQWF